MIFAADLGIIRKRRLPWAIAIDNTISRYSGRCLMSEPKKTRPKVPEGKARFLTTRQKEANEKGFVGYDVIWDSFQKEVEYETPKRP